MKATKRSQLFLFVLTSLCLQNITLAKVEAILGPITLKDNPNIALHTPTTSAPEIILSRSQYVISYNKERRNPNWVAWKLEASQMGSSGRSNLFAQDPDLESYLVKAGGKHATNPAEYKGSCLDRGHQIPSADRTDTVENNDATFLMSNMIPQTPYLNRVVWEHLESYTRYLVHTQGKKIYVIAGPIYDEDFGAIGPHADIQVPSKDFKVILVLNADQTPADIDASTEIISVIMPNTEEDGSHPTFNGSCHPLTIPHNTDTGDWKKYKTSLAEVERLSGVTFNIIH
jgi:endonuclease G